ncbi:MAG: N-formylglutamate amidohydrolase, partial [Sneathiella sp.]
HLIDEGLKRFGVLYLVDCHSMPSSLRGQGLKGGRPDIILGNRYGTSCDSNHFARAHRCLTAFGYDVGQNAPYAGGFITAHYGNPEKNVHSLQIEINRNLYMNQQSVAPSEGFETLQKNIGYFIAEFTRSDSSLLSA